MSVLESRILDAAKVCLDRWGMDKVTIDDIASESGVSRATLYRLFPGGREVLFEALRVRELEEFFTALRAEVDGAEDLEELLVGMAVAATRALRADEHLAVMLATEPGQIASQLTVEGLPRIISMATAALVPQVREFLEVDRAALALDLLARIVISYFLAPSGLVDLGEPHSARAFLRPFIAVLATDEPVAGGAATI